VQAGLRIDAVQDSDLVPQYEQFAFFDADERPSRTSQPQSRTKMR